MIMVLENLKDLKMERDTMENNQKTGKLEGEEAEADRGNI
jgi:hypothetical protein